LKKEVNMLQGSIFKGLLAIAIPIMLMNVVQALFNVVDMTVLKMFDTGDGYAVGAVGSALNQLENPAAKVAGIVGQAIANIALGFAQATAKTTGGGIFGWIAAITGGLATMVSTISAIHNATGYAQGGIVKGSTYSGDRVQGLVDGVTPVGLNAGEVVLNHSQQATLAAELTDRDNGGGTSSRPYVDAETIYLGVSNYLKRSGRGEIVTTKK
jgi:hypothetical protein